MKIFNKKVLCLLLSAGVISSSVIGLNRTVYAANTAVTPTVDQTAQVGNITKVMVTFLGDTATTKGFTWYTSRASIKSDLQIIEQTSTAQTPDFTNAATVQNIAGSCAVPSNKTDASAPANTTTSKLEYLHKAEATGLKPNTTYFYRVGDASLNLWSQGTFQTASASGDFSFIDLADPQAKDYGEGLLAASTFKKALDTVPDSKFIDLNGDIVDDGSVEYEWDWLFNNIGKKFLNTTIAPIAGNHDDKSLGGFSDHFDISPAPNSSTATGVYYSYDYSNAHFVMLNCNECDDPSLPSYKTTNNLSQTQIDWLKSDVNSARARGQKWVIVTLHKGPYSTSNHATDIDLAGSDGARKTLAPVFSQLGVDLVLQGHDHIYARSKPIKADNTAVTENLKTESFNGHNISYDVNPGAPVYLIPGTAGPKVYYKNKSIISSSKANGYDPNFYNLFDVADENHAAIYGAAAGDVTRPERSNIQNFESINVNGDKLSVISYEIDQNRNNANPYIVDMFGIDKSSEAAKTGALSVDTLYANAYSATSNAMTIHTQKSIDDARSAIGQIPKEYNWAIGELSKQVDIVQGKIATNAVITAIAAVEAYEAAPIDTQPHITSANALGAVAQTAVSAVTDTLTNDTVQARINAQNAKVAAQEVYIEIGAISSTNGTITLTFNNPLAAKPAISAFAVTQTIGTGATITVAPTAVTLDSTGKIVTLTVPQVAATSAEQSIVDTVSYDTAVPVTAGAFKVAVQIG